MTVTAPWNPAYASFGVTKPCEPSPVMHCLLYEACDKAVVGPKVNHNPD